jgi:hypothetical protein
MTLETYYIPTNLTDAGRIFGVFETRNLIEAVVLTLPVLYLCFVCLPLSLTPKIIVTLSIAVPVEEADTARRYLDLCELEVLEPRFTDDFLLKLLYEIINKKTSQRVMLPEGVFDMTTAVHGVYEE